MDDSGLAGFLFKCTADIPLPHVLKPVSVAVKDNKARYYYISQVLPHKVPFRDTRTCVDVPALVEDGRAFVKEIDSDVYIPDLLLLGEKPRNGEDKRDNC